MEFRPAAKACCHSSPLVKQVLLCGFSALVFHGIFLVFQTLQLHDALVRIGLLPKHSIASSCPLSVTDIDDGLDVITYFLPEQEAPEPNVGLNVINYIFHKSKWTQSRYGRRCKSISSRCSFSPQKRDVPKRSCRVVWPRNSLLLSFPPTPLYFRNVRVLSLFACFHGFKKVSSRVVSPFSMIFFIYAFFLSRWCI